MVAAGTSARKLSQKLGLVGVVAGLGLLFAAPAHALHRNSPGALRISNGHEHALPSAPSWGNWTTFASSEDLTGTGNTTKQIFVFNLAYYDCESQTLFGGCPSPLPAYLQQVTNRPGAPDNPVVDKSGTYLVFDALGSFNGNTGAAANRRQIFLTNLLTGELIQITRAGDGDSVRPSIDQLGSLVVFESAGTVAGRLSNGISQLYAYQRVDRRLSQITNGQAPSQFARSNLNGSQVAFESRADLLGDQHDTGIEQIFVYEPTRQRLLQITRGNAPCRHPYPAARDKQVYFDSAATNLPGTPGGTQVYVAPTEATAPAGGHVDGIEQLTHQITPPNDPTGLPYGDCSYPAIDGTNKHLAFICTADYIANNTTGSRLFALDLVSGELAQLTGRGDVRGPISHNVGLWFITFADNVDLNGEGACGYQLHVMDYYAGHWDPAVLPGTLPPDVLSDSSFPPPISNVIGSKRMLLEPGDATNGSNLRMTTRDGDGTRAPVGRGSVGIYFGPLDLHGVGPIKVAAGNGNINIPPIEVERLGAICLTPTENGTGVIDCDGGRPGGDVLLEQDHRVSEEEDPACVTGCREGRSCQGTLPGPHIGQEGVCNGPINFSHVGTFAPGGLTVRLQLSMTVATLPGVDGEFCTPDDNNLFANHPVVVELTTGTANTIIYDADNATDAALNTSDDGTPIVCDDVRKGDFGDAELVGSIPLLDVPTFDGVRDVILRLSLQARPPVDFGNTCLPIACDTDEQCNDNNVCTGTERCVNHACAPGIAIRCDDNNACNGSETCDPATGGCLPGTTLVCDDDNSCTDDSCVGNIGCVHANNPAADCDDGDACTDDDRCHAGQCEGTPFVECDDGKACNGVETCNPTSGVCIEGTPPNCDDGNTCTADSCQDDRGCVHTNAAGPCNDNNACTGNDSCQGSLCAGTPAVICDDGKPCNGQETCNPQTGACVPGNATECDDGNPCTDDTCTDESGCVFVPNTAACDDDNPCTENSVCRDGACEAADEASKCDDQNPCNGIELCDAKTGQCKAGPIPRCDDGDPCTRNTCSLSSADAKGCFYPHVGNYADCRESAGFGILNLKIQALLDRLHRAAPDAAGGVDAMNRLDKLLISAQKRLNSPPYRRAVKAVGTRLKTFKKLVQRGVKKTRMNGELGAELLRLLDDTMNRLEEDKRGL